MTHWDDRVRPHRSVAARRPSCHDARRGHVDVNGTAAKPSTSIKVGDRVEAYLHQRRRVVVADRLITKRVGAATAIECYTDHSPPPPERPPDETFAVRERGAGRPTKRERRQLDRLRGRRR